MFAFIHPFNKYPVSSHVAIDSILDAEHTGLKKKKRLLSSLPKFIAGDRRNQTSIRSYLKTMGN